MSNIDQTSVNYDQALINATHGKSKTYSQEQIDLLNPAEWGDGPLHRDDSSVLYNDNGKFIDNKNPSVELTSLGKLPVAIFNQAADGRYLCTDKNNGAFGRKLFWFDGNITAFPTGTITAIAASDAATTGVARLLDVTGTVNVGGQAYIKNVNITSTGTIFFLVNADSPVKQYHLYRIDPGTNTVGNNSPAFDNYRAVLNLGSLTGTDTTQTLNVRALHERSLAEVDLRDGGKALIFTDYNVAAGRVSGGLNDQCIAWISKDDGITWQKLIEFNTGGTHHINHFHSVVQDPYSGYVYIMTGDEGRQCSLIRWDTLSSYLPANTAIENINDVNGWNCIYGNEYCRFGDLVFTEDAVFGLPDSDDELSESHTLGYSAIEFSRDLQSLIVHDIVPERVRRVPPLIHVTTSDGSHVYGCLKTSTADEHFIRFYTSYNPRDWKLGARVQDMSTGTAVIAQFFEDNQGHIIASVLNSKGGNFIASESGSCVIFTAKKVNNLLAIEVL